MNPARRLAWYVAYNIRPRADVQRGDRWMPDPMLPAAFQPHNDHFRGTGLDRGHLRLPHGVLGDAARGTSSRIARHFSGPTPPLSIHT